MSEEKIPVRERALKLKQKSELGELAQEANFKLPEMAKKMHSDKAVLVNVVIHMASSSAAVIGIVPIPIADSIILIPIQFQMLRSIYKIYGVKFSEGLLVNFVRMTLIPYIAQSLVNFIPGGSVVNASVAAAITEAIGWSAAISLENGEDIMQDVGRFENLITDYLKTRIKKGKHNEQLEQYHDNNHKSG